MAKKQTRRSVSIRGTTYDRIRNHCEDRGVSMSEFVEELISKFFDAGGRLVPSTPTPTATAAPPAPRTIDGPKEKLDFDELHDAARHFTF